MTGERGARGAAFAITWLSYATYYLGRKGVGVVRTSVTDELGPRALHGVETALLAAYALGQYVNGFLGDRLGPRRLVALGMLVSAASCAAFAAAPSGTLAGLPLAWLVFVGAYAVNGVAQASGWPGNVKAMADWTTPAERGRVMGVWSTCYQVGGIVATAVAARAASALGWRAAFWVPALAMAAVALVVWAFLRPGPHAAEQAPPEAPERAAALAAERRVAQRALLRSPLLYSYGAAYFCIKLVRYSLLFWLPLYLEQVLHYEKDTARYLSTSFEVGGLVGTILLGWASDRASRLPRAAIALASLVGLGGALVLYARLGERGPITNFAVMALVGLLLFGPDALLSGAAAQDAGGKHGAALAAGMVNGIGSLGAILQELVTRGVSARWGWDALFRVFVALAFVAALCLVPALVFRPQGPQPSTTTRSSGKSGSGTSYDE